LPPAQRCAAFEKRRRRKQNSKLQLLITFFKSWTLEVVFLSETFELNKEIYPKIVKRTLKLVFLLLPIFCANYLGLISFI